MASRAERNRKRKAVVAQRRGRKLKETPRFACGKARVEPILPNPIVVAARAKLLGVDPAKATRAQIASADNPLDLALFHGWISQSEHKAGEEIAALYRRAGMDLPAMRTQDFDRVAKGHSEATGNPQAYAKVLNCIEAMRCLPRAHAAVFALCVQSELPEWMAFRLTGDPRGEHNVQYAHLRTGLRTIARELGLVAMEKAA